MTESSGSSFTVILRSLARLLLVWALWDWSICPTPAQEASDSLTGESSAEAAKKQELIRDYNLRWGPVSFQVLSSFHAEFTDNALNSGVTRSSDEILRPEVKLNSYWPVTDLNALTLSLGVNYEYYVKNTALNSPTPLISPGSEVAFLLYIKNLRFRFHERFSYLESLYYGATISDTGQLINLNNIGVFGRFDNFAGFTADWDLGALVLSLGYDHENFISTLSTLDYLTRASELLSLNAEFVLGPQFRFGLESKASSNAYETEQLQDHWRARLGPFVEISPDSFVSVRAGGGYETVLIPRSTAGLETDSTPYYGYARMTHTVNDWLSYSLSVAHENQLGWNTANLQTTYAGLSSSWRFIDKVELTPSFNYGLGKESGPNYAGILYRENYNYFQASLRMVYRLGERWTADLQYAYFRKDSDVAVNTFYRNRINAGVTYRF
jgi:hypothetical protein